MLKTTQILFVSLFFYSSNLVASGGRTEIDSLLIVYENSDKDSNYLKLCLNLGYNFEGLNVDSSILFYQEVIQNTESIAALYKGKRKNLMFIKAKACRFISYPYKSKMLIDSAITNLKNAIEIYDEIGDRKLKAYTFHTIGATQLHQGNFNEASKNFYQSLDILLDINDPKGIISNYNSLGILFNEKGSFDKAIEFYLKSIEIAEGIDDKRSLAIGFTNIGSVHLYQENYSKAIEYHRKSLVYYDQLKDIESKVAVFNNIGLAYFYNNNLEKAIRYIDSSLILSNKNKDLRSMGYSYNILGEVFFEQGEMKQAHENFQKALDIREKIMDKNGIAISSINLSSVFIANGNYTKANMLLNKSETIAKELDSQSMLREVYRNMKKMYESQSKYELAYKYFKKESTLSDSIFNERKSKQISELETKYQSVQKDREIESLYKDNEIQQQQVIAQRRLILFASTLFVLIVLLGLAYSWWSRIRQRNIKNELQIQNLLNEQKMLRSQMNPHFIYNSLNSIQAFISSDESYQAEKYLARFAKLMRGILENSRNDFVLLEKEIEVLDLYMELEQLRFENRFTFNVELDENLEAEFLSIPPMLIQPFIENAILHGFTNRTNGKLTLSFAEQEKCVYCVIDDNGIGREEAATYRTEKKHQSLATKITEERLVTLSQQMHVDARFQITDKIDLESGKALGTKVEVWIPFQES